MIIFGAGASYGSIDASPSVPPLGYQLFFDMQCSNQRGMANDIAGKFAEAFARNFEDGMEILYQWQEFKDISQFQREIAICLLRYQAGEKNLYSKLIQKIRKKFREFCFVSLNYDLLFEDCAFANGFNVTYLGRPKSRSLELLKIHGSSNFLPNMGSSLIENIRIVTPKGMTHIDCEFKAVNRSEAIAFNKVSTTLGPVIAQYMKGKYFLHAKTGIQSVVKQFKGRLQEAKKILIVGVAVNEYDTHIWGELENTKAQILYVGLSDACEEFREWSKKHNRQMDTILASSFSETIALLPNVFGK